MTKLILAALALPLFAAGPFAWKDAGHGHLDLTENGKPVLTYNYAPQLKDGAPEDRRRCCYIFPLYTPAGTSMLDDFPKDHYHHRGLFWGWPVVETPTAKLDGWMMRGLQDRWENVKTIATTKNSATLTVLNAWYATGPTPAADRKLVDEKVELTVHPAQGNARSFDVVLTLKAVSEPVTLRGSQEKGKSYGGFSARFAPRTETRITADSGPVPKDEDLVPHAWAEFSALYEGKPATLRIASDARNTLAPYQWCLRPYGFIGASFPGRTDAIQGFTLEPNKPLTLRFTVTVSDTH